MKKRNKPSATPQPKSAGVSPTLAAAIDIDLIQKRQDSNNRRIGVLNTELNKLHTENLSLEAKRQECLRQFDRTTR